MRFLQHNILVAGLAGLISATPLENPAPALDIKLASSANTKITADITNTGKSALRLLNKGTFLDSAGVEKLKVYSKDVPLPFQGIRKRIKTTGLGNEAFTSIGAGEKIQISVDMAAFHDLSTGGLYKVLSQGSIPFAEADSNALKGSISYKSNTLELFVDGAIAAKVPLAFQPLDKRSFEQSDCAGAQGGATAEALSNCAGLASQAAQDALSGGSSKFSEYFHTTDYQARQVVAARLSAVANECSSSPYGGVTRTYCTDVLASCDYNTLAYTMPTQDLIVNCPLYFSDLPPVTGVCHAQDQATTTLHETTHADGVYSPGTLDLGYGYNAIMALSSTDSINNADSYAMYANALHSGC